jgi:protein-tyrosine phosphatase
MSEGRTSHTHPLRVDFIDDERFNLPGRIGMTFAPGKKKKDSTTGAWDRELDEDLRRLREEFRTDLLVSLIEEHEFAQLQIEGLREQAPLFGIEVLGFPIRDVSVPYSIEQFHAVVKTIVGRLGEGETVVIHCMGGLGRTGVMAAACLIAAVKDLSSTDAIEIVRRARAGTIETRQQEDYISEFKEFLIARSIEEAQHGEETEREK